MEELQLFIFQKSHLKKIDSALKQNKERFQMPVNVENKIESKFNPIGKLVLVSGFLSMAGAVIGAIFF